MATELKREDYSVGWICAIPIELTAALAVLEERHPQLESRNGDNNVYSFGRVGKHNIVVSCLPNGGYGITRASILATHMHHSFKNLRFILMVGVAGGAPSGVNDIRLGDIVVSQPTGRTGGVIQYDFGKAKENGEFEPTKFLNAPPQLLQSAVSALRTLNPADFGQMISDTAQHIEQYDARFCYPGQELDRLFRADYHHSTGQGRRKAATCNACDTSHLVSRSKRDGDFPYIHYGIIASANQVMKDGLKRNKIKEQTGALCFEMEAAGLMGDFRCLVIRGICDYCDGHKNKLWQPYAALVAALYAKHLLLEISSVEKEDEEKANTSQEIIQKVNVVIPFCMPYPRIRNFTGRSEELNSMQKHLNKSRNTPVLFALTGTGGIGKTQIAIEYAYRHHGDYTGVFWVSAASEDSIRASYHAILQCIVEEQGRVTWPESTPDYSVIGSKLGISNILGETGVLSTDSKTFETIRSAIFRWFQLLDNKWLLIVDNADDLETFDLKRYLPNHGNGAIVITSRRPEFSHQAEQVNLDGLDRDSAIELLSNLAHVPITEEISSTALQLIKELGHLPLAICQAGYYIRNTKVSFEEYMNCYDTAFVTVQSDRPKFGWNYRSDTVATTWEVSYRKIYQQDKKAALMLLACSYFDPEGIAESLIEDSLFEKALVKKKVLLLASYSLIKIIFSQHFAIHPVVHSWARTRNSEFTRPLIIYCAVAMIGRASIRENVDRYINLWNSQEEMKNIVSHAEHLHRYLTIDAWDFLEPRPEALVSCNYSPELWVADIFLDQGKFLEALQWYTRAYEGGERMFGGNDSIVLSTIYSIGYTYKSLRRYDDAIECFKRVISGREEITQTDHEDVLGSIQQIAEVLIIQGKDAEADEWFQRSLIIHKKMPEVEEGLLYDRTHNVGVTFYLQKKYEDAFHSFQKALRGFESVLGKSHMRTLVTLRALAGTLERLGKYEDAMRLRKHDLSSCEEGLGKNDLRTFQAAKSIGDNFLYQGRHEDAARCYKRSLFSLKKIYGEEHFFTSKMMKRLGRVYAVQGQYGDAIEMLRLTLAIEVKFRGEDDPATKKTLSLITSIVQTRDHPERLHAKVIESFEKKPGAGN